MDPAAAFLFLERIQFRPALTQDGGPSSSSDLDSIVPKSPSSNQSWLRRLELPSRSESVPRTVFPKISKTPQIQLGSTAKQYVACRA